VEVESGADGIGLNQQLCTEKGGVITLAFAILGESN